MSYKNQLSDLDRDSERSLTAQLVDLIAAAIASGELSADEQLPPTRELAELAGVNHLTAVRAYRRLRELGLVSSQVGRGTFVRGAARASASGVADSISWQRYALPAADETYGDRVLSEMHRQATNKGLVPLSVGYPSARLFPADELAAAFAETMRDEPEVALQYSDVQGTPELADQLAALSAARGAPEDPDDIVITNGASQALALACRAILRPGDLMACEDPSFTAVIRASARLRRRVWSGSRAATTGSTSTRSRRCSPATRSSCWRCSPGSTTRPAATSTTSGRARVLELARRHGFFVLEDGIYGDLRLAGEERTSLRAEAPAHVVYVDSLSKTVAGGLRIGWVAASGPVLGRIVAAKRADDIHSPTVVQLAVARYLASGAYPAQTERARAFHAERLEAMTGSIERHLGGIADYTQPLGGGHLWLHLDLDLDERELADEAVRQGVAYVPGNAMRIEERPELNLRLSFGYLDPAEIDEGLRRMASAIRALRRRPARRQAVPV